MPAAAADLPLFSAPISNRERLPQEQGAEDEVSVKLVCGLLTCLGWDKSTWFQQTVLPIRFGSTTHSVKPDFVLAPDRRAACTIGKAYAVIEVKRAVEGSEQIRLARQQARSYADYLRVPFYAVADGMHIRVWERFLLEDDKPILATPIRDLLRQRKEIECVLGARSLPGVVTRLRANPTLCAADVLKQPETQRGDVFLRISNRRIYVTAENSDDVHTDAAFWWGPVDSPEDKRRILAVDWDCNLIDSVNFVDMICRLLLHRGIGALHVSNPDAWRKELKARPLLIESQIAAINDLSDRILPREGQVRVPGPTASSGAPLDEWTDQLSASLDKWMVERTNADLDALFQSGEATGLDLTGWTKADGLIDAVGTFRELGASREQLDVGLLRAMVHARTDDNTKRHGPLAHVRLGPASRHALLEGLLFGLALSATFESVELAADASAADLNVRYHQTGRGLVFGLDGLIKDADLPTTNEWNRVFRNANLLALTRLSRDRIELARARTIGSPALFPRGSYRAAPTIGAKCESGIVFTFDDDTKNHAANGWEALRKALVKQYEDQISKRGADE